MPVNEDLYRQCLLTVAPDENRRAKQRDRPYAESTETTRTRNAARQEAAERTRTAILNAMKPGKQYSYLDIANATGVDPRAVSTHMTWLANRDYVIRRSGGSGKAWLWELP